MKVTLHSASFPFGSAPQGIAETRLIKPLAIDRDSDRAVVIAEALQYGLEPIDIARARAIRANGPTGTVLCNASSCDVALSVESNRRFPVEAMSTDTVADQPPVQWTRGEELPAASRYSTAAKNDGDCVCSAMGKAFDEPAFFDLIGKHNECAASEFNLRAAERFSGSSQDSVDRELMQLA